MTERATTCVEGLCCARAGRAHRHENPSIAVTAGRIRTDTSKEVSCLAVEPDTTQHIDPVGATLSQTVHARDSPPARCVPAGREPGASTAQAAGDVDPDGTTEVRGLHAHSEPGIDLEPGRLAVVQPVP